MEKSSGNLNFIITTKITSEPLLFNFLNSSLTIYVVWLKWVKIYKNLFFLYPILKCKRRLHVSFINFYYFYRSTGAGLGIVRRAQRKLIRYRPQRRTDKRRGKSRTRHEPLRHRHVHRHRGHHRRRQLRNRTKPVENQTTRDRNPKRFDSQRRRENQTPKKHFNGCQENGIARRETAPDE